MTVQITGTPPDPPPQRHDFDTPVPNRQTLVETPTGPIVLEIGADGTYLRFECDCQDALPYCKGQCCSIHGIAVTEEEMEALNKFSSHPSTRKAYPQLPVLIAQETEDGPEMVRSSDSWCCCLDRTYRTCNIYDKRPETCREFHCTRTPGNRGFLLNFSRLPEYE